MDLSAPFGGLCSWAVRVDRKLEVPELELELGYGEDATEYDVTTFGRPPDRVSCFVLEKFYE